MRVLLDGCVPKGLAKELSGFDVRTAPEMEWGDLDDGPLLDIMEGRFDVLVTVDKNLPTQQRIADRSCTLACQNQPPGRPAAARFGTP